MSLPHDPGSENSEQPAVVNFFEYGADDTIDIGVKPVQYKEGLTQAERRELETTDLDEDDLGESKTYKVHAGYHHLLAGMLREIEFITLDKFSTHELLFRAEYLKRVLDVFVQELAKVNPRTCTRFRSKVLNPILQRQLRGVHDNEPDAVRNEVGESKEDAAEFYLSVDPLDPSNRNRMRHNILYIWSVRLSLAYWDMAVDEDTVQRARVNTQKVFACRGKYKDHEWNEDTLYEDEVTVILSEGHLRVNYDDWMEELVGGSYPLPQAVTYSLVDLRVRLRRKVAPTNAPRELARLGRGSRNSSHLRRTTARGIHHRRTTHRWRIGWR
jgi:hypothetical protein